MKGHVVMQNSWSRKERMKLWGVYLYLTSVIIIMVCIHFYYNIIFQSKLCMNFCLIPLFVVNFVPWKGHGHISLDCTKILISLGIQVFVFPIRWNKDLALFFSPCNSNTTMWDSTQYGGYNQIEFCLCKLLKENVHKACR